MLVTNIIMTLSNVLHVGKSSSTRQIDFIIQEKNTKRKWRDAFTKANTNMTILLLHRTKLMSIQKILATSYNFTCKH